MVWEISCDEVRGARQISWLSFVAMFIAATRSSPQLLVGYYNDSKRTEEAFASGWCHRGDLAVRDVDGYITVVEQKKDMIHSGGDNVASREVE